MISVVILINTALGFVTEFRARQAIRALSQLQPDRATVLRGGKLLEVGAQTLVPGDVVALEEGQRVPADLRLLYGEGLQVDEAILTGESAPVVKDPTAIVALRAVQHEQQTMAFQALRS